MKSNGDKILQILNEHSIWVLSLGKTGSLADLNSWKLDSANLEMANLPFARLHFTSLKNAKLSGANFRQAELLNAGLRHANLDGADLEGANLSESDLSFSQCTGTNFCDANLEGANFEGANLVKANFTRAILRGANFKGADLSFSEMVDANIEGADFKSAKIEETNLEGANIDQANFEETALKVYNIEEYLPESETDKPGITEPDKNVRKSPKAGDGQQKVDRSDMDKKSSIKLPKEDSSVDSKSVNPDKIEAAVVNLINQVKSDIRMDQVKARCKQQPDVEKIAQVDFVQGDIISHNDQIAFKLDYKISYKLSILLDRNGNLIMDYPDRLKKP